MALPKLTIAPNQSGYAVTDGTEAISTKLEGGAARYRKDIMGATALVNVQWDLNPIEFEYVKSFYNLFAEKGASAFAIDLYIDNEALTEHECHFVPGSFRLSGQRGKQYSVSAQLEAKPITLTEEEEEAKKIWTILFGELGENYEELFPYYENIFDEIITFDLPEAMATLNIPVSVEVLGAGFSDIDGDYLYAGKVPDGELNAGNNYYKHTTLTYYIVDGDSSGWSITGGFGLSPYYTNPIISKKVPKTNWAASFGPPPAPTIEYGVV